MATGRELPATDPTEPANDPARRAETWVLTSQAPAGQVAALAVAALVAWSLPPALPSWQAGLWFAAVVVVSTARALAVRRARTATRGVLPGSAARVHLGFTVASGALWALLPWLLPGDVASGRMFLVTLGILGLTAGAAVAYAPSRFQFEAFSVPPVLSLAVDLFFQGETATTVAALLCVVYLAAMIWLGRMRREDAVALAAMEIVLESLHRAALRYREEPEESLRDLLAAGCRYYGLDLGIVAEIRGQDYRILAIHSSSGDPPCRAGDVIPLEETVCAYTVQARGPVSYARGDPEGRHHPAYRGSVPTYIGQAILVDGKPFGTVNFSDLHRTRFRASRHHRHLIELMAQWLGSELSRRRAEGALARQRQALELLTDSIPALISYVLPDRTYGYVNSQYERYFGRSRESFVGASLESVAGEATYSRLRPYVDRVLAGEEQWLEFSPEFPDGRSPTFSVHYVPDWSPDGRVRGYFALLHEVTAYKATEFRLLREVHTDYLTGLANRRGFLASIAEVLADHRKRPASDFVCYLDLDRFKTVNDRGGHGAGDAVLRQVAELMRETIRQTDVLARIGGDEFGLLLPACTEGEARTLLESLRRRVVEHSFAWEGHRFRLGISIGATAIDRSRHRVETLLREADAACYAAKAHADGSPVFFEATPVGGRSPAEAGA